MEIMRYGGTLLSVKDMKTSRNFYEMVMEQTVVLDLGDHVSFENGLSLQLNYEELVGVKLEARRRPNNFQLYFEADQIDAWENKLKSADHIEFIHSIKEYPWGQRTFRFYDPDQYIVEVSECMESVARRCLAQGLTVEETAERTMYPVELIQKLVL